MVHLSYRIGLKRSVKSFFFILHSPFKNPHLRIIFKNIDYIQPRAESILTANLYFILINFTYPYCLPVAGETIEEAGESYIGRPFGLCGRCHCD
jgi:hypothetical protein